MVADPVNIKDRDVTAPDGGRGWVVVFAALVFSIIYDGCSNAFGILYIQILEGFNETKSNTAWTGSLFFSMPLLLAPTAGIITANIGPRLATMLGGLIVTVGFAIGSCSTSIPMLVIFYGLFGGIGMSLPYFSTFQIVTDYFDEKLALAFGIAECGAGLGTVIFAPLTEYFISTYGWRGALLVISGLVSNIIVCGALFCPVKQNKSITAFNKCSLSYFPLRCCLNSLAAKDIKIHSVPDVPTGEKTPLHAKERPLTYLSQLKSIKFLMFALSNFVMYFWYDVPYMFIVSNTVDIGISIQKSSYLLSIIGIVHFFGIIGYGVLCNRKCVNGAVVYGISTGLCGVAILLVPVFQEFIPLAILSGCFGLFSAPQEVLLTCILIDIVGKTAFDNFFCGFILFMQGIANLLGPPFADRC
ncbi:monocarboxylate transporter 12-B-like [Mercenaria mercenaria]|uniref:monocarboxylate transporter 12-B-like n=1 Tax=Mercenaria mercenaria TaxID=6596 RepID=UPI00234F7C37|nr:monocarboxylate transporter 12-B-like [Mercenaria mercenaria]